MGPGRGCKEKHHIGRGSQAKELTCLASPPLAQLTLLMTRPRELDGTGDMGGSGLGASEGCGSGSELTGASTAGHWAPAGSSSPTPQFCCLHTSIGVCNFLRHASRGLGFSALLGSPLDFMPHLHSFVQRSLEASLLAGSLTLPHIAQSPQLWCKLL